MSDYRLTSHGTILRQSDGATIPADPDNADYRTYLDWREAGGTADPAEEADRKAEILAEILVLEQKQARPLRELALATDDTARAAALQRIRQYDERIAELRGKMGG